MHERRGVHRRHVRRGDPRERRSDIEGVSDAQPVDLTDHLPDSFYVTQEVRRRGAGDRLTGLLHQPARSLGGEECIRRVADERGG